MNDSTSCSSVRIDLNKNFLYSGNGNSSTSTRGKPSALLIMYEIQFNNVFSICLNGGSNSIFGSSVYSLMIIAGLRTNL